MYFAPLMMVMKALVDVTDKFIYEELISGMEDNLYYLRCAKELRICCHGSNLMDLLIFQFMEKFFSVA